MLMKSQDGKLSPGFSIHLLLILEGRMVMFSLTYPSWRSRSLTNIGGEAKMAYFKYKIKFTNHFKYFHAVDDLKKQGTKKPPWRKLGSRNAGQIEFYPFF